MQNRFKGDNNTKKPNKLLIPGVVNGRKRVFLPLKSKAKTDYYSISPASQNKEPLTPQSAPTPLRDKLKKTPSKLF